MEPSAPKIRFIQDHAQQIAIDALRTWLGDGGTIVDQSSSNDRLDFVINYVDGRTAVGDVWLDADPVLAETWSNTHSRDEQQIIRLREGAGFWDLTVEPRTNIKQLYKQLPGLIDDCNVHSIVDIDFRFQWHPSTSPISSITQRLEALGVVSLTRREAVSNKFEDSAWFFPPFDLDARPGDPTTVADWFTRVLTDPVGANHVTKILDAAADEKHAFVVGSYGTQWKIEELLRDLDAKQADLKLPTGLTHAWVASRTDVPGLGRTIGCWSTANGWTILHCQ